MSSCSSDSHLSAAASKNTFGTFAIESNIGQETLLHLDAYSAAMAFINGRINVTGDLCEAVRFFRSRSHAGWRALVTRVLASLSKAGFLLRAQTKAATARDIQYHYDRSNEFYQQFLDPRMQYSAAYYTGPGCSLEEAQRQKLDRICRQLRLEAGQQFLDIGCGWGGLVIHAAAQFGVTATGCTISTEQFRYAGKAVEDAGLAGRVTIRQIDYRDLTERFAKIASVGMFEHVGHARMQEYFRHVYSLLAPGGLFLNRGIVRPEMSGDDGETLFLQRKVFPGGSLIPLSEVVREAEHAGFEVVAMEDVRLHYGRTCRAWVENLVRKAETCRGLVGDTIYRTWLLYLAASAVGFEDRHIDCVEVLFASAPR
jgi:cyclopropane-fatty-acyl-phospholipid synthase